MLTDGRGANARPEFVQYRAGRTPEFTRAASMVHWDFHESKRVCEHNVKLAVYWARHRLLKNIRGYPNLVSPGSSAKTDRERPIFDDSDLPAEYLAELVTLRTCMDVVKAWGAHESTCAWHRRNNGDGRVGLD